jgi:hypothetical protein
MQDIELADASRLISFPAAVAAVRERLNTSKDAAQALLRAACLAEKIRTFARWFGSNPLPVAVADLRPVPQSLWAAGPDRVYVATIPPVWTPGTVSFPPFVSAGGPPYISNDGEFIGRGPRADETNGVCRK